MDMKTVNSTLQQLNSLLPVCEAHLLLSVVRYVCHQSKDLIEI